MINGENVSLSELQLKKSRMGNVPPGSHTDSEEEDNEILEVDSLLIHSPAVLYFDVTKLECLVKNFECASYCNLFSLFSHFDFGWFG